MQLKTLDYVVIVVEDLELSVAFYTVKLGLRLKHRSDDYAQIEAGATRLGLFTRTAMAKTIDRAIEPHAGGHQFELGFFVEDCDQAFAELRDTGVTIVTPPRSRSWGQRTAYVADPDGNLIELVQDIEHKSGDSRQGFR